jgi:hypothetical protein
MRFGNQRLRRWRIEQKEQETKGLEKRQEKFESKTRHAVIPLLKAIEYLSNGRDFIINVLFPCSG